ncbi:MAG: hypothetical protein LC798_00890 [Chloroflexi bacterium]|nr:hypothetical protein [Chloroflexota bacterium]
MIVIGVLLGVSALTGGSDLLGVAAVPVIGVAALGWLLARRAGGRGR